MSRWSRSRRLLMGSVEILLLVLLALSMGRFFSEEATRSGRPIAARQDFLQTVAVCPGDTNLDGQRDVVDLVLIQAHLLGKENLALQALANADVNSDGTVDVRDVVKLVMFNLGKSELPSCEPIVPTDEGPFIRIINPVRARKGDSFTLVGGGFSPTANQNTVLFFRPGSNLQAAVSSATEDSIVAIVPDDAEFRPYAVAVMIDGEESNAVGFEISGSAPRLDILPSTSNLLLPPGTGKELLAIGGGIPPYKLLPLSEDDQLDAIVELKGNTIEVTGLRAGSIRIDVEDSAETPAKDFTTVNLREPRFEPAFQILPHTLLAGSTPGFTIELRQISRDMRLAQTEIEFDKIDLLLDDLAENETLALSTEFTSSVNAFLLNQVTEIDGPNSVSFEAIRGIQNRTEVASQGKLRKGSAILTLDKFPVPPPEGVTANTFRTRMVLKDGLFQLPQNPGESFDVTARFTSTTVFRGQQFNLTKTIIRTFQTTEPAPGAPRIQVMRPIHGELGRKVEIQGTGFDPQLEENRVTFRGLGNTRVDAILESATAESMVFYVPSDAISGPVRVEVGDDQSNDFEFRVLFRPRAALFFPDEDGPGALAPDILLSQDNDDVELDTLTARVDGVTLDVSQLELDVVVGTAPLVRESSGFSTPLQIFFKGLEEDSEPPRQMFELKEDTDSSTQATLFVSEASDPSSVTFELVRDGLRMRGRSLVIDFAEGILPPVGGGTPITSLLEVRSVQWNFFRGTEMVVLSRLDDQ